MVYLTVQKAMAQPLLSRSLQSALITSTPPPPITNLATAPTIVTGNQIISQTTPAELPTAAPSPKPAQAMPAVPSSMSRVIAPPTSMPTPPLPQPVAPTPLPTSNELNQTVELGRQAQTIQVKIIEAEKELTRIKTAASQSGASAKQYTQEFNTVFSNLQALVKEASEIKKELERLTEEPKAKPSVKVEVIKPKPQPTPIVLTSMPNVINGIITSPEGNYLESVVVVIHDKDGLPVRALKTNKLGQFTGTTPLPNGTYNVELEKDDFAFDVLQVELKGAVMPPLMISAKTVTASS